MTPDEFPTELLRSRLYDKALERMAEYARDITDLQAQHAELVTALKAVEPVHDSEGNLTLETVGMSVAAWTEKRDAALGRGNER